MPERVLAPERRERIVGLLGEEGRLLASDLARRLGVSLDTVRRDLDELAAAGALRRVHGGALPRPSPSPRRFADRRDRDVAAKTAIAAAAVPLVASGTVLALGGGTTVLELARGLPRDLEATVITSAPDVALALLDRPALEVVLLGGRVDAETRTVVGAEAVTALAGVRADLCLLGACSLHAEAGLAVLHREQALVEAAMLVGAARVAVLTTGAKLGSAGPFVVGATDRVDVLVTDAAPGEAEPAALAARGVEVVAA